MTKYLLVLFVFTLNGMHAQNKRLKKTAKLFNAVVSHPDIPQDKYQERLSNFLDPSANTDSLTNDYYTHWKSSLTNTSFPSKVKVKQIKKNSEDEATLTIHCDWYDLEFGTFRYISESIWLRKNGQWYRSEKPEILICTKKLKAS